MNAMTPVSSNQIKAAIRAAVEEAKLAYQFSPGSYAMGTLNAILHVERLYHAAERQRMRTSETGTAPLGRVGPLSEASTPQGDTHDDDRSDL